MVTGADIKAGYGQKREKPYNSILPYLRAEKEAEKASQREQGEADKPEDKKASDNE